MNIKLEKRNSKIHGLGIFTKNKISKGTEFYYIPLEIILSVQKPKCARIGEGKFHSCNPNSELDITKKKPVLKAKRDILANEEITVDYHCTEKEGVKVPCKCKDINCHKYLDYAS